MKRHVLAAALVGAALLFALSCGDDENPTQPGTSPTPSVLSISSSLFNELTLNWTRCDDSDFSEYRLYRSLTSGIVSDPSSATLIATVSSAGDTLWFDQGLDWSTTYYYALQTHDTESLSSWSNEVDAATPDSGSCYFLTCYQVQGQQASSPYEGQEVNVLGVVSVGADEFYTSGAPYAVLADGAGGPWGGLVLYGDSLAGLARGDSILISGEVTEYYGLTELSYITNVQVLGTGAQLPDPETVTTGDLATSADPEAYEAVLVTVTDAIVTSDLGYGEFLMDDGSGECMFDDLGYYSYDPAVGDTVFSMTGVLWYSYSDFKLEPRDDADIDASSGGGGGGDVLTCYEVQGQQASSPYAGQTVSVTGIVTVAGDEYYSTAAYAVMADAGGGPWTGLWLYGNDVSTLARGDSITITGEVQEYYGLTELSFPTSLTVHSAGHALPDPEPLTTGDLATASDPEQWESVLVSVSDVDVTEEPDIYGEWKIDDGSGECRVDDLGTYSYSPQIGDPIVELVGALWYSYDEFKIEPRDDADITR